LKEEEKKQEGTEARWIPGRRFDRIEINQQRDHSESLGFC
jgi:hypothetical protein